MPTPFAPSALPMTSSDSSESPASPAEASSAPPAPTSSPPPDDAPLLPPAMNLGDAVGAPTKKSRAADFDEPPAPRNRKVMTVAAIVIFLGLLTLTLVLLGRANSERYLITCKTDQVRAERGRAFPPWGSQLMAGTEYKPIALPANAECKPQETDNIAELDRWYLDLLVERASATLTAPVLDAPGKPLDIAEGQLNQALLLSRAPERRDQRREVERLLGDVQYWRASLRLRDASAALQDASKQFEAAAAQRPRHVSDAGAWAGFLKRVVDELKAGPNGVISPTAAPAAAAGTVAPVGTALPVEAPPAQAPVETPPDAGVPTGGVLL